MRRHRHMRVLRYVDDLHAHKNHTAIHTPHSAPSDIVKFESSDEFYADIRLLFRLAKCKQADAEFQEVSDTTLAKVLILD